MKAKSSLESNENLLQSVEITEAVTSLWSAIQNSVLSYKSITGENTELRNRIFELEKQLSEIEITYSGLNNSIEEQKIKALEYEDKVNNLKDEIRRLNEKYRDFMLLDEEISAIKQENVDLKSYYEEIELKAIAISELNAKLDIEFERAEKLHSENDALLGKLKEFENLTNDFSFAQREIISKDIELNIREEKNLELQNKISVLENQLVENEITAKKVNQYKQEIEVLLKENTLLKENFNENNFLQEEEFQKLVNDLEKSKNEIKNLEAENEKHDTLIKELKHKNTMLENENIKESENLIEILSIHEKLKSDYDKLNIEKSEIKNNLLDLQDKFLKEKEELIISFNEALKESETNLSDFKSKYEKTLKDIDIKNENISVLEDKLVEIENSERISSGIKIQEYSNKINKLESLVNEKILENNIQEETLLNYKNEIEILKNQKEKLKDRIQTSLTKIGKVIN